MKKIIILICFFASGLYGQQYHIDYKTLDVNNIEISFNNYGAVQRGMVKWELLGENDYSSPIVFDQGLWVVAKKFNQPNYSFVQWQTSYSPGPIINGQPAMRYSPENDSDYVVYSLEKDDTSSWYNWPVEYGAPSDSINNPILFADKSIFTVYNGLDTIDSFIPYFDPLPILPIEVHQTSYAYTGNDSANVLHNVIFTEYTIINKGLLNLDSCFIGFWTDIDFLDHFSNFPAVDTLRNLSYCWSDKKMEINGDSITAAVGYVMLYGPAKRSNGSSAVFRGREIENYKNTNLNSFHGIIDDGWLDPVVEIASGTTEAWNIARGLDTEGNPYFDPTSNYYTRLPFNGDPVSNTGWLWTHNYSFTEGGAGFNFFAEPVTMVSQDTQWVMIALVPAKGKDHKEAITNLRNKVDFLLSKNYDELVNPKVIQIYEPDTTNTEPQLPEEFKLFQNYPNPFNPTTTIKYSIPGSTDYQSVPVKIVVYDMLGREATTLVNEVKQPGVFEVPFNASNLSSGVYIYRIQAGDFVDSKKMILLR